MPIIELALPGTQRTTASPVAETYRITVERIDGIACTEIEASTTMSMFCIGQAQKKFRKTREVSTPSDHD